MGVRLVASVGGALLLAGCGAGTGSVSSEAVSPTGQRAPAMSRSSGDTGGEASNPPSGSAQETTIVAGDSEFGTILYDDSGQAIYLFDVEITAEPKCYGECADAWPPVLTESEPAAGNGVEPGLLGTTERSDGRLQVTYDDHPLYFYAHEGKHEVLCHDVFLNGGTWFVVRPDGKPAPPAS
jgi:predicted lipoprotein with Yx(FWY)xxD motif